MTLICKNCGTIATGDRGPLPGSGAIELVLWLFALLPGVIYSIWRRSGRPTCAGCGSRDLVASDTPVGRQLLQQYHPGATPAPLARRSISHPHDAGPLGRRVLRWFVWALGLFLAAVVVAAIDQRI